MIFTYHHCNSKAGDPRVKAMHILIRLWFLLQSNLDSSNTDGSFTMANSNSFLSTYEVLPIAQENKYLGKLSYFIVKLYLCVLIRTEAILMSTLNIQLLCRKSKKKKKKKKIPKFASRLGTIINPQWLKPPVSNNFLWSQRYSSCRSSTVFYFCTKTYLRVPVLNKIAMQHWLQQVPTGYVLV